MRFAFVLNPAAKSGRAAKQAPAVLRAAHDAGLDASLHLTEAPGHATPLARALAESHDVVVAVGGDGTVQEVIAGLVGADAAFGVIPMGTGNDLACALGMPTRIPASVSALAESAQVGAKPLDVGRLRWRDVRGDLHERTFANCVGAGFDGMAANEVLRYKRLGGRAAYLAAIVRTLRLWRSRDIVAEVRIADDAGEAPFGMEDAGEVFYSGPYFLCEIGNGHSIGGGIFLTPEAKPDDGVLDLCLAQPLSLRRVARVLPLAMKAAHMDEPEVSMGRARRVAIRALSGVLPMHADGEPLGDAQALDAEVVPNAIRALWGPGSDR